MSLPKVTDLDCEVAQAIEDGTITGPHIYGAGARLSHLAGYGGVFPLHSGDV